MNVQFRALLAKNCSIPHTSITRESHLSKDLGLDSLDIIDLILQIEDLFQVSIPDDEYMHLITVGQFDDYLRTKIATTIFYMSYPGTHKRITV